MTRGIDLDQEGYLRLSKRSRAIMDDSIDSDFGEVIAICFDTTTTRYYILTAEHVFYADSTLQTFTDDASANVPTTLNARSDMVQFNDDIYVSAGITDGLRRWTGSAWSTSLYALTSNTSPMCVFESKNQLAIGQANTVILINTSHTLVQTLTLPADYTVTTLAYSNNRVYVGTRHSRDGEALVFEWDGDDTSANNGYPCGAVRIDCIKAYKNSVVAFTGEGQLLIFNGGGFTELANLPIYYTTLLYSQQGNSLTGSTSHRGMIVVGDSIYINLLALLQVSGSNDLQPFFLNTFPGGIWCYDPAVGLYHKHKISADLRLKTDAVTTANVNTTTEIITVAGQTVPATGTPVIYDSANTTAIGGLTHRKKYYVIYQSDTTMKLATTKALADAGTAINLTGTGNNAQYFVFCPNRDFGGDRSSQSTAIAAMNLKTPHRSDGATLLFGATIFKTAAGTSVQTLNALVDTQESRGVFVTPRLDASGIEDNFTKVTVKFKGVKTAEDVIVAKYQFVEREDSLKYLDVARTLTGTWSDANTFTSTASTLSAAKVGDEVTIHSGSGMGYTLHISAISEAGGTYTIDFEESAQNVVAAQTFIFTVENWEKMGTVTTSDVTSFTNNNGDIITGNGGAKTFDIAKNSTTMKLKFELRGEDVTIEDILVNNQPMKNFIKQA